MDSIDLDSRAAQEFFDDAINLAKIYCQDWKLPDSWPSKTEPSASEIGADPGLALLKLFSYLIGYLAQVENGIPFRWQAAFYRFLDASLRTALPSFAPIRFTLADGQPATTVPAGSAVHDTATQTIRFETDEDLRVVPARIDTVLTMAPALDSYIDCLAAWKTGAAPVFVGAASDADDRAKAKPLAHWLMVGDPVLFQYDATVETIEIAFSGWHLGPEYFRNWYDGMMRPFDKPDIVSSDGRCQLSVRIKHPFKDPRRAAATAKSVAQVNGMLSNKAGLDADAPDAAADSATAAPGYWLLAEPADGVRVLPQTDTLPTVRSISCTVSAAAALPQQTAANNAMLDLANGGYPFGKSPSTEDAFYVRFDKAFAYPGAAIVLRFVLADSAHAANATLDWQFWDGAANLWTSFIDSTGVNRYGLRDGTSNLATSGQVSFTCPVMGKQTVAGTDGYWIRAVLTAFDGSNGYGFEPLTTAIGAISAEVLSNDEKLRVIKYFAQNTKFSFVSRYESTQATKGPFIQSLTIDYAITATPNLTWRHNAFRLDRLVPREGKTHPYLPLPDMPTTLYIGFDCADVSQQWVGERVSVYFEIENERAGNGSALSWEWLDARAQQWRPLLIEDHTAKLARSASIHFSVLDGMRKAICFSREGCWLRVSGATGAKPVRVAGIYVNTTGAFNVRTFTDVILGSSNGLPDQQFLLPFAGVHELQVGERLDARNVGAQSDIRLQVLEPPALDGNLTPENADTPLPVDWICVESFVGAGPKCRCFTVEARSGTVTFGNGTQGMIPPAGTQNIIVTRYRTTDGKKGNVPAGSLGLFAAGIPGIAEVDNPTDARGGVDGEDVADLVKDAPTRVRANNHAITLDDLKSLAEQASARVCRVIAIAKSSDDDTHRSKPSRYVQLVVLAKSDEPRACTAPSILDDVFTYVTARSPIQMQSRVEVKSAKFKSIDVYAVLKTNEPSYQWESLKAAITDRLETFLHPVAGGMANDGWPFGATVPCQEVSTFLAGLNGVLIVDVVTLCGDRFQVELEEDQVPTPGSISLILEAA